ncbi:MAG: hypothetical protein WCH52_10085 [Bacteroidota bacterium]
MKKGLLVLFMGLLSYCSFSQEMRINTYGSYAFRDRIDSRYDYNDYYNGIIEDGFLFGGGMEFMATDDYGVELSYLRMNSSAFMNYYKNGPQTTNFTLATNYVLLGGNRYFDLKNKMIEPYAGAQAGVVIFGYKNPDNNNTGTITKIAWGLKTGVNVWATKKVGIKFQAQFLSAVQSLGGGFYLGTGGSGAAVTTNSTIFQFGLGGGIMIKLAPNKK